MTDGARWLGYRPGMGKSEDDEPPICRTCLGAGGEWMELNGNKDQERRWVQCTTCSGTGRR
ncbi:hypothetical protein GCM10009734_02640 [Nonomuraea bangladeshensis]